MNTNIVAHENTTMSSFDIAILTGSRNSEVVSVAKTLSNKKVIDFFFNHLDVMQFDKRNSLVLVANLSPEFTAAVSIEAARYRSVKNCNRIMRKWQNEKEK